MPGNGAASGAAWPWPFSRADLTAGLRRQFSDPTLQLEAAEQLALPDLRPGMGFIRGLRAECRTAAGPQQIDLVVKEPRGITRIGLAGAGRREVGVYQALAQHLPLRTPRLIGAMPAGDWLILERIDDRHDPAGWGDAEYHLAIEGLADLHDRFWGLGDDLGAFAWLSRPLETDFEVHVQAAAQAIERIVNAGKPEPLAGSPERMHLLARLTLHAEQIAAPLRRQPQTLLHGDYWPGNIAIASDGDLVVYDWQLAAIGPAIMDLLVFITKRDWWYGSSSWPRDRLADYYRRCLGQANGFTWDESEWEQSWDHALMWRFVQEWVDLLAAAPDSLLYTRAEQLDDVWLGPVSEAADRRLEE
jgi:hypothetical protein